eukprot:8824995-Lingulodinium_polyedra.AAC.1
MSITQGYLDTGVPIRGVRDLESGVWIPRVWGLGSGSLGSGVPIRGVRDLNAGVGEVGRESKRAPLPGGLSRGE